MKRAIIVLSRDHVGKTRSNDRGATVDINQDGKVTPHEHEAHLVMTYGLPLESWLVAYGHRVIMVSDDGGKKPKYKARQDRADAMGADLYLTMHLNALKGRVSDHPGNYATLFYHYQTTQRDGINGFHYGSSIRDAMRLACPELDDVKLRAAAPGGDWANAYATMSYTDAISLCLEPYFVDQIKHLPLIEDGDRVGHAIAFGIHRVFNPGARPLRPLSGPRRTFA